MANRKGRFILYSDTSKLVTGSVLYQFQDGKPRLIAYVSKRMPEAAKNYSITELEMCGLAINIATFSHLLKGVDFDAVVDHLAITHIIKSKMEPTTNRIKRLLEILSSYSFNLYYIKGKDMVLSDFLFRQLGDKSDPHQIIPISFNMKEVSRENDGTNLPTVQNKRCENHPPCKRLQILQIKEEKEIKLIIIDDTPITNDTLSVNSQQNCMKAKLPPNLTTSRNKSTISPNQS